MSGNEAAAIVSNRARALHALASLCRTKGPTPDVQVLFERWFDATTRALIGAGLGHEIHRFDQSVGSTVGLQQQIARAQAYLNDLAAHIQIDPAVLGSPPPAESTANEAASPPIDGVHRSVAHESFMRSPWFSMLPAFLLGCLAGRFGGWLYAVIVAAISPVSWTPRYVASILAVGLLALIVGFVVNLIAALAHRDGLSATWRARKSRQLLLVAIIASIALAWLTTSDLSTPEAQDSAAPTPTISSPQTSEQAIRAPSPSLNPTTTPTLACTVTSFPLTLATNEEKACLDEVAKRLKNPRNRVLVLAHSGTDESYPEVLARRRAEQVRDYLMLKPRNIMESQITVRSAGPTKALYTGTNTALQARNRRAEVFSTP